MRQVTPNLSRAAARWTKAPEALFSNAFAAGFAVAALVVIAASARVFGGGDPGAAAGRGAIIALGLNLVIIAGLAAYLGVRVWRLVMGRAAGDPAPKLHLRFAGLFSLVAIAPALIVAALLGALLNRGMDSWFSERTQSLVEDAAEVAESYLRQETDEIRGEVLAMAVDLNRRVEDLSDARIQYQNYLITQAQYRNFIAAYVIDSRSTVLARAVADGAPEFAPPSVVAFRTANDGEINRRDDVENDLIYALFKLEAYDDAFLYVVRRVEGGILEHLLKASESSAAYREAEASRGRLRLLYFLLYLETVLLVLIGAAGFGLSAANQVVGPVGRLVEGAERVRDGDLSARVKVESEHDELTALSRAFNEMTAQLASQRRELMKATTDAEQRREFTEAVLAGVSAGVIGLDSEDEVTLVNRSAAELLGAEAEADVVGRSVADVAPEIAGVVSVARAAPGHVSEGQIDLARRGDLRRLNVRAAAAKDGSGSVVVTFDDITQLVSDQRNAAWGDVARRIAHEIKNPLTPIQLSAERLRRKYLKDVVGDREVFERCVDTIVRQVSDIRRMVDEFSSFARMPQPRPAQIELGELVRTAAFAQRVASPNIEVTVHAPEEPVLVVCDERLIVQAFANVLKNAAEAVSARQDAAPGAKASEGRIDVTLTAEDDFAVVKIVDDGVGWPEAPRERLAEPYMTTREKGTGLGLAIVRRVMEDHHGRLELADREDGETGAVVRLVLPLQPRLSEARAEQDDTVNA